MSAKIRIALLSAGLALALIAMSCQLASGFLGAEDSPPTPATPSIDAVQPAPLETAAAPPAGESEPTAVPPADAPPAPTDPPSQPEAAPVEPSSCAEEVCIEAGTFLLQRPLAPGGRNTVDPSNRFGEYMRSTRSANLGAGFLNSTGAVVVAAADGIVVVSGDDSRTSYAQRPNLYGNLVILEHNLPGIGEPVYTLYAHLSEVSVAEGDSVSAGQEIGKVGMSGNVSGSTLHFEIRQGENSLDEARNPDLWLLPLQDENGQPTGALAGSIIDASGDYVEMGNIVLERLAGPGQPAVDQVYIQTYTDKDLVGQPPWGENFAVGELPPGEYQVSFWLSGMQQMVVRVEPGKLTIVNFKVE
jgi:murein DD-endopeptidase MepM/ murein hydrolase activator NlpD